MDKFKQYILYIIVFIIIIFIIPSLCTKQMKNTKLANAESTNQSEVISNETKYDYKKYKTVKLLHKNTENIEELPLDEYLYGVVSAEMPANYEIEALKAQAVAARTYTIYHIINDSKKHGDAQMCNDSTCCQAWISKEDRMQKWDEEKRNEYWKKIVTAVDSTAGKIITYENEPINAFFHSNSGGTTEIPSNVWIGGKDFPYLKSVETAGEDQYSQYNSEVVITKNELLEKLKLEYKDISINFENNDDIKVLEYTRKR